MYDLAIVGAGPAGMAAAVSAADAGLSVVTIDEQQRSGGQIFRRAPAEFVGSTLSLTAGYGWASGLIERFDAHPAIERRFGTTAIGVLRDRTESGTELMLAVNGPGGDPVLGARRILLATGAYDLPVAFPGWTLPGVMTAGAVQSLLKGQRILAGREVVLAGSHPLLLLVADQLRASGARVSEVAFARGLPTPLDMVRALAAVPGHVSMLAEMGMIVGRLVAGGVKISTGTIVTGATAGADGTVTEVELSSVDRSWHPVGAPRTRVVSTLVLGYGFSPSTELARQAGSDLAWDSPLGGWVVQHDENMATTAAGIYVAGEPTGIAGADRSRAEGEVAGLAIARELCGADQDRDAALAAARRHLRQTARFAGVVQRLFEPQRAALAALARPDTSVCRCESVSCGSVHAVLDENPFMSTVSAVKLQCRSGMGPCQGRYCEGTIGALVAAKRDQEIAAGGYFTAHLPVKPTPVRVLGGLDADALSGAGQAPEGTEHRGQ